MVRKIVIAGLDPRVEWRVNMLLQTMGEIYNEPEKQVRAVFPDIFFDDNAISYAIRGSELNIGIVEVEKFSEALLRRYQIVHQVFRAHNSPYQFFVRNIERDTESVQRLLEFRKPLPKDCEFYEHLRKDDKMMPVPGSMFALLEKQLNEHFWQPNTKVNTAGLPQVGV